MTEIRVPISVGELIDKITILEIKSERIKDQAKLANVRRELGMLRDIWASSPFSRHEIDAERDRLKKVNETLWELEDFIRVKEVEQSFDEQFVEFARAVYVNNDERAALKRRINEVTGSSLVEEKDYPAYETAEPGAD